MTVAKLAWLNDVQTTLEGITTGNGYHTTVATVQAVIRTWDEVGRAQLPLIGYGVETAISEPYLPGGLIQCKSTLNVVAHVSASTAALALTAICNLEDDIIAALMADPTRDANAIDTRWVSTVDTIQDPTSPMSREATASMVMQFEVVWERTTGVTA